MRIVVAMSGGVDSSVAAAVLAAQGHEVIGLSMRLYDQRDEQAGPGTCCAPGDLHDARRVAAAIGIPHYVVHCEREFDEQVIGDFVAQYAAGRTPVPCVRCNRDLKFATLLSRAVGLGADLVATGHYARVEHDTAAGGYVLRRGADPSRDQSYFLFPLAQGQLARASFPIGGWTKDAVREYARSQGLPVADKRASQEICFVPDGDYAAFVERRAPAVRAEGVIVDRTGTILGRHAGVHRFTVGQRKGLGLSSAQPLYVLAIRPLDRTVVVGPRGELERTALTASQVNWIAVAPPAVPHRVTAQIRYRHTPAPARVRALDDGRALVEFDAPQLAVTPGQAVVFYEGDRVLGGGWID
jgi:tRNA-uridine 2-sulfurtransferase